MSSKVLHGAREAVLTTAAVLGTACLVLVVLGAVLDASLVVFRTGSMAPTMPTGSLAVVRQVDARDVVVGDVVTVERGAGQLPITHRVVRTTADPTTAGGTLLELQGDANAVPDPAPYAVDRVGRVVWSAEGLGAVAEHLRTPPVLGGATLLVAVLVTSAAWPRADADEQRGRAGTRVTT
ncbi:signal peptidase I [Pseudokineococcus basanitobsidens]|uniref:Signal peptidase I n=1 Tax=Pseudokineococcus basanitobsidens TaxID=1926649 RepID=A0ABU8RM12_9ACTN